MSNEFCGVYGVPDPAAALCSLGLRPTWHDADVAFAGAPIWTDASGEIVVSGEIVLDNAPELRRMLGRPEADPGALLAELYRCQGTRAGRSALGMFAVAIWDTRQRRLVLMRDGVGARTLYYAHEGKAMWFAARLRVLRRCPAVSLELSLPALRDYLTCAFVPGAQTLWRDAWELRPGTALTLPGSSRDPLPRQGRAHTAASEVFRMRECLSSEAMSTTYWEPEERIERPDAPMEVCAARLRPLLEEAVHDRLPTSGPVGVLLSGGLDSSLVTALAARAALGPIHTYALHFGPDYPNELAFSSLVARHCNTRHHVVELSGRCIRDRLPETLAALDDPIGDPLTTPNLLLGQTAAQEVTVLLNGEGGDPCFGGPKNLPMLLHELYGAGDREVAYLRSFQKCYDDLPYLLTPEVQAALRDAPLQEALFQPFFTNPAMPHYLNRLMHLNVRLKGADHILTKVNNLTSANGLLGRSPLFDRRIVEASFTIPPEYKQAGTNEKAVLKHAVADLLPEAILTRPKSGMLVPVQGWFRRDLRRYARSLLLSRRARTRPYFNQACVREWLDYGGNLWPRHGVKLWLLLTLEVWLRVQE